MSISGKTLFQDNVNYNTHIAKRRTKPKHRGMVKIMRPEQVLRQLSELGINITERTLQRYTKQNLIPQPERKSAGRGKGKITDYPKHTPAEAFASWKLQHGKIRLNPDFISEVRVIALEADAKTKGVSLLKRETPEMDMAVYWLAERSRILAGFKPDDKVTVKFISKKNSYNREVLPGDKELKIAYEVVV